MTLWKFVSPMENDQIWEMARKKTAIIAQCWAAKQCSGTCFTASAVVHETTIEYVFVWVIPRVSSFPFAPLVTLYVRRRCGKVTSSVRSEWEDFCCQQSMRDSDVLSQNGSGGPSPWMLHVFNVQCVAVTGQRKQRMYTRLWSGPDLPGLKTGSLTLEGPDSKLDTKATF